MGGGQRASVPQVVLITGCTKGGIGYALAEAFMHKGCRVFASARRLEAMAGLPELGIDTLALDVTSTPSIQAAVGEVVGKAGRIDVLVNNAGMGLAGPAADVPLQEVRRLFETNLFGALEMTQAVFPHMAARGSGRIVNVGSVAGYLHRPWNVAYTSSKAALHAATSVMRLEMKPLGIHVILVTPGAITSNIHSAVPEAMAPLSRHSFYKEAEPCMLKMSLSLRDNPRVTPSDKFARIVADKTLQERPPWRVVAGHLSGAALLLSWLPMRVQDLFLWRSYGWKGLGRNAPCGAGRGDDSQPLR